MQLRTTVVFIAVVASACGDGKKSDNAAKPAADSAAVAAVNAKIPATLTTLKFEAREVTRKGHSAIHAIAPVGWQAEMDAFPGNLAPAKTANLGFMTGFDVGTGCNGTCEPKDWKAVIEDQIKKAVPDDGLIKDEPLPNNGRIRWGITDGDGHVYAAWYTDGAREYKKCSAWLDDAGLVTAIDAFVEACKAAKF